MYYYAPKSKGKKIHFAPTSICLFLPYDIFVYFVTLPIFTKKKLNLKKVLLYKKKEIRETGWDGKFVRQIDFMEGDIQKKMNK